MPVAIAPRNQPAPTTVGGPHEDAVAVADDPDDGGAAQGAVGSAGDDLHLLRGGQGVRGLLGPGAHGVQLQHRPGRRDRSCRDPSRPGRFSRAVRSSAAARHGPTPVAAARTSRRTRCARSARFFVPDARVGAGGTPTPSSSTSTVIDPVRRPRSPGVARRRTPDRACRATFDRPSRTTATTLFARPGATRSSIVRLVGRVGVVGGHERVPSTVTRQRGGEAQRAVRELDLGLHALDQRDRRPGVVEGAHDDADLPDARVDVLDRGLEHLRDGRRDRARGRCGARPRAACPRRTAAGSPCRAGRGRSGCARRAARPARAAAAPRRGRTRARPGRRRTATAPGRRR